MARLNNSDMRSHDSPMDFKYDNANGPLSEDSPFPQAPANSQKFNTFAGYGHKRTAPGLDSPTKPHQPFHRSTEQHDHPMPSTPSANPTLPPWRASSFTTPRTNIDTDFSSGPEQSSPAYADMDDTPDPPERSTLLKSKGAIVEFAGSKSENKGDTKSLFGRSGRGEVARRPYNDAVAPRRVEKRRRRDADKDVRLAPRRSSQDSDYEERPGGSANPQQNTQKVPAMGVIPSILTFIDAHPSLPNTLSFYVQFLLNCFFAFCMMYVLFGVYSTIKNDIDERAMMESSEIFAEMTACTHEYKENRCDRNTRVPAMEMVCNNWEKCMQRDPLKVGRSRLSAVMFAQIFNGFIEPISLKAIVVSITVIVGCFAVNNLTFGLWRAKTHQPPTPQQQTAFAYPPPHQQQHPMDWQVPNQHFYTPHQHQVAMPGVGMAHGNYQVDGQSPSKRLGYR